VTIALNYDICAGSADSPGEMLMPYPIAPYLNVRSAMGGTFRPDGKRLAFLTDITGTHQVWAVDVPPAGQPTRWPDQLTFFKERVLHVSYSPTQDEMIFSTDVGGNERAQLFLLSGDGRDLRQLTTAPQAIHSFGGWSHDGRRIAYASNARDPRVFDIYVMEVQSGRADMVHKGDGWCYVAGFSPDDTQILIGKAYSSFHQDLWLLDLGSGARRRLTPAVGEARYEAVFAPDGRRLYVASDLDRDFLTLAHLDLHAAVVAEAAPPLVFRDSPGWDVSSLAVSHGGNWLAYHVNADGYTQVLIESLTDGSMLSLQGLPPGVCELSAFSVDGQLAAITVNSPRHNPDVWVADLRTGATRQVTRSSRAGLPQASFVAPELIRYPGLGNLSIASFLYRPLTAQAGDKLPVLCIAHGGPESQTQPTFAALTQYFLNRGYAVFAPNVRGSTGYGNHFSHLDDVEKRLDAVADLAYGARYLVEQGIADPQRIAIYGGSYGGFMVLAALTEYSELWAAGIDVVGIANFLTFLENTGPWRRDLRIAEYGDPDKHRELLERISPINHVQRIRAPLLVIHGANDPRVPVGEAEQIVAALRARSVPVAYLRYEDEGHGLSKLVNRLDAYGKMADFLDQYL
jgi:dipeptidyl aminopeptidase/acylaminoacyl peptidase